MGPKIRKYFGKFYWRTKENPVDEKESALFVDHPTKTNIDGSYPGTHFAFHYKSKDFDRSGKISHGFGYVPSSGDMHTIVKNNNPASFFELINLPPKGYFDFDAPLRDKEDKEVYFISDKTLLRDEADFIMEEFKGSFCEVLRELLIEAGEDIDDWDDLIVFDLYKTTYENKISYHGVTPELFFKDNGEVKAIVLRAIDKVVNKMFEGDYDKTVLSNGNNIFSLIDLAVYKSNNQFRMLNCSKVGKNSNKGVYILGDDDDLENELTDYKKFERSLICHTEGLQYFPVRVTPPEKLAKNGEYQLIRSQTKKYSQKPSAELIDESEAKAAYEYYLEKTNTNDDVFKFQYLGNNLIILTRLKKSSCELCKREHEHENSFLVVVGKNKGIYYNCRRNNGQKLLIGELNPRDWSSELTKLSVGDDFKLAELFVENNDDYMHTSGVNDYCFNSDTALWEKVVTQPLYLLIQRTLQPIALEHLKRQKHLMKNGLPNKTDEQNNEIKKNAEENFNAITKTIKKINCVRSQESVCKLIKELS